MQILVEAIEAIEEAKEKKDGAQEKESKPTEQNQVLDEKEKKEQRVQFGRLVNEMKKIEKKDEYKKMDYFLEEFAKIRDMGRPKLLSSKSIPSYTKE